MILLSRCFTRRGGQFTLVYSRSLSPADADLRTIFLISNDRAFPPRWVGQEVDLLSVLCYTEVITGNALAVVRKRPRWAKTGNSYERRALSIIKCTDCRTVLDAV